MAVAQVKKILELTELQALDSAAGLPIQMPDGSTGYATLATLGGFLGAGGGLAFEGAAITGTQASTSTTPAVVTGLSFALPAGAKARLNAQGVATLAATGTGLVFGFQVAAGGTTGSVTGAWFTTVAVANAAGAGALQDGDVVSVAAGATTNHTVTGTASTAGNNGASVQACLFNNTDASATVSIVFATEVGGSAATLQIGTSFTALVG